MPPILHTYTTYMIYDILHTAYNECNVTFPILSARPTIDLFIRKTPVSYLTSDSHFQGSAMLIFTPYVTQTLTLISFLSGPKLPLTSRQLLDKCRRTDETDGMTC